MNRKQLSKTSGIALIVSAMGGMVFTSLSGALTFVFLFLTVAVLGVGLYKDSYQITILGLASGACAAALTAGVQFVYYGSFDLLIAILIILSSTFVWKIISIKSK